ncbi:MAG TPA: MiaB/RimO family radical SAM methylthiotransferase [Vicinamibacterales bacterium]|nr:MiaB/RimO family radical SAM methylthiotransferase [Vicinamibacterales bacterium]
MKYSVITFGCRVNQADSLSLEDGFRRRGAIAVAAEEADLVVVNTCSVTASADQAARQTIRRLARVNPTAEIVVTGCYATRRSEEIRALPHVLRVVTNEEKGQLISLVEATTAHRFGDGDGACGAALEPGVAGRTAFTLRVQTGCAEKCSYCIIPTTRGLPRSLSVDNALSEVDRATEAGFREIALTGVHLGSYGRDLTPSSSLVELMRRLAERWARPSGRSNSEVLFRVSSLEPMDCTPDIVRLVASAGSFAPHFHLPLQHASNRMLMAMERPYTIEYYRNLVETIRATLPEASIGADVIVGFPGETDEEFAQLASYLESSSLTHLHVFPYSDRPGTAAASRRDKVHGATVRDRAHIVRRIGQRLTSDFRESQIGTAHRGLTIDDGSVVVTGNYLKVRIPPGRSRNEWVDVRITAASEGTMIGELDNLVIG